MRTHPHTESGYRRRFTGVGCADSPGLTWSKANSASEESRGPAIASLCSRNLEEVNPWGFRFSWNPWVGAGLARGGFPMSICQIRVVLNGRSIEKVKLCAGMQRMH